MSADIQTVNPDQLPEISQVPEDLRVLVASPSGPLQRLHLGRLVSKLIAADLLKVDEAALAADLAHDENTVAVVHSDVDPANNGWYRKIGPIGAGTWVIFEQLAKSVREEALQAALETKTARDAAMAFLNPAASQQAGEAATVEGEPFAFIDGAGQIALAVRTATGSDTLPTYFSADKVASNDGTVQERLDKSAAAIADTAVLQRLTSTPESAQAIAQTDGKTILISGNSLSYDRYSYDQPPGPLGDVNEADKQFPGAGAWTFLLRDAIHRADPAFVHADELLAAGRMWLVGGATWNAVSLTAHRFPFNNRVLSARLTSATDRIEIEIDRTGYRPRPIGAGGAPAHKITLHFVKTIQSLKDHIFDISVTPQGGARETAVANVRNGGGSLYVGYEPFIEEIIPSVVADSYTIDISNVRNADGSPITSSSEIFLQATGSLKRNVIMTGRGGWRLSDIRADFTNRIGQHNPDLLLLVGAGANDRPAETKEQTAGHLGGIIDDTLAVNPNCRIIVTATTPATTAGYGRGEVLNGSTMGDYIAALREASETRGAVFDDDYSLLENLDPAEWLNTGDNIHPARAGQKILLLARLQKHFGVLPLTHASWFDPEESVTGVQVPGRMLVEPMQRAQVTKIAVDALRTGRRDAGSLDVAKFFTQASTAEQDLFTFTAHSGSKIFNIVVEVASLGLGSPAGVSERVTVNGRTDGAGNIAGVTVTTQSGATIGAAFDVSGNVGTFALTPPNPNTHSGVIVMARFASGNGDFVLEAV